MSRGFRTALFEGGNRIAERDAAHGMPSAIAETHGVVALNHSELRVLKKLLGRTLPEIQSIADEEGKSLEQFVREGARYYARRLKA